MNPSMNVFLVNNEVRAVKGIYEPDLAPQPGAPQGKSAKRNTFKTFDRSIQVGDIVVVPSGTRHGMTTYKITDVDVEVDFDCNEELKWIVARVDATDYEATLRKEGALLGMIRSAEKRKKQEELKKALILDQDAIKTLEISSSRVETPVS